MSSITRVACATASAVMLFAMSSNTAAVEPGLGIPWLDVNVVSSKTPSNAAFSPGLTIDGTPTRIEQSERNGTVGFKFGDAAADDLRMRYKWRTDDQNVISNQAFELLGRRKISLLPGPTWTVNYGGAVSEPLTNRVSSSHVGLQVPMSAWVQTSATYRNTRWADGQESSVWPLELRLGNPDRINWSAGKTVGQGFEAGTERTKVEWPLSKRVFFHSGVERRPQANNAYNGQIGVQLRW